MKRRTFFKKLGISFAATSNLAALLSAGLLAPKFAGAKSMLSNNSNILVLIQLHGGNDGLNSVIPLDGYDNLVNLRKNIIIKENDIIKVSDTLGFHPKLAEISQMFLDGDFGIIQNVGYELQNRSHFRSMDIWNSGSPSDQQWSTGWLGRYLDNLHEGYPVNYPSESFKDPLAINIGNIVADTCQGVSANYSYALDNLKNTRIIDEHEVYKQNLNNEFLKELQFLNSSTVLANAYTKRVETAAEKGSNVGNYPDNNNLAQQLKMVAKLISGGLTTQIYTLTLSGFDTHAYQTMEDTNEGFHAVLLKQLSQAVYAFQNDLKQLGLSHRVMGMTYSEFGRQIKSNSANGTDHGNAAPIFLFGSRLKQQVIGKNPVIHKTVEDQTGLPVELDFRDVYSSVLVDWMKTDKKMVDEVFKRPSTIIPISKA
ncbi:MAG: DUF1501 domain-containing protein [Chitinophagales bacterium]